MNARTLLLCCTLIAPGAWGQVDLIWSHGLGSGATGPEGAVMILPVAGSPRVLAQEHEGVDLSTRRITAGPLHEMIRGLHYVYWFDAEVKALIRGYDSNRNGVIDPLEFELLWDASALGEPEATSIDLYQGQVLIAVGAGNTGRGVYLLTDLDADERFQSAGEVTAVVPPGLPGATMVVEGNLTSADHIASAAFVGDGSILFIESDERTVYRWHPQTLAIRTWFRHRDPGGPSEVAINPDIGGPVPSITGKIKRITVHRSVQPEIVYLPVEDDPAQPITLSARDWNSDGDVNDAGEVIIYHDGATAPVPSGENKDGFWWQGSMYMQYAAGPNTTGFIRVGDFNGDGTAMQAGEQIPLGTIQADPSSVEGLATVYGGMFPRTSCVAANLEHRGLNAGGGSLQFTLSEIPSRLQGNGTRAFIALSGQLAGRTQVSPLCVVGFELDALTDLQLDPAWFPFFTTGTIDSDRVALPPIPLPAGLPVGLDLAATAVFFDATGVVATSQARRLRVR